MALDEGRPIFQQIAELIENGIVDGSFPEESQVPSTNELAAFHCINPATAAKGLNLLAAGGVVYKRRGVGMFVAAGAREALRARRRHAFAAQYIGPLLAEAAKLGLSDAQVAAMIEGYRKEGGS